MRHPPVKYDAIYAQPPPSPLATTAFRMRPSVESVSPRLKVRQHSHDLSCSPGSAPSTSPNGSSSTHRWFTKTWTRFTFTTRTPGSEAMSAAINRHSIRSSSQTGEKPPTRRGLHIAHGAALESNATCVGAHAQSYVHQQAVWVARVHRGRSSEGAIRHQQFGWRRHRVPKCLQVCRFNLLLNEPRT